MSAARSPVLQETSERVFPRHAISVPMDLIALRSGVPENVAGRWSERREAGVGAVVAGELSAGEQVAVELRLPNVGVQVRARELVRYQSRLRCGFEFVEQSVEQREMIRYWIHRSAPQPVALIDFKKEAKVEPATAEAPMAIAEPPGVPKPRIRIGRGGFYALLACLLAVAGLGAWQWQRSWNALETHALIAEPGLRNSPETIEKRVLTNVDPGYPETARNAGMQG